jgi:chaperonin cofactor prefoldin
MESDALDGLREELLDVRIDALTSQEELESQIVRLKADGDWLLERIEILENEAFAMIERVEELERCIANITGGLP